MLYNIFLANNAYLCNVKRKKYRITRCLTAPETREHKPRKRYQAMRKGAMCQALNSKLQKLLAQQASAL